MHIFSIIEHIITGLVLIRIFAKYFPCFRVRFGQGSIGFHEIELEKSFDDNGQQVLIVIPNSSRLAGDIPYNEKTWKLYCIYVCLFGWV
jgi:hypothetical protein